MVLHVTGAQLDDLLAFELVEQVARVLAQGVDQDVQATAVGHADYDFLGAVGTAALDDLVDHRDQAFAAFQAETLGARVLGAQVLLQAFGRGQALEQVRTRLGGEAGRPRTLSRRWRNHLRCSESTMCMNSAPKVPQ